MAYGEGLQYSLVEHSVPDPSAAAARYIVARDCIGPLADTLGGELRELSSFPAAALQGGVCAHPLREGEHSPLIPAAHVSAAKN